MEKLSNERLFNPGRVVATPGALDLIERFNINYRDYLDRHLAGDWGDMCDEDKAANDKAIGEGTRIFSAYQVTEEDRLWVITEADRSGTTFLLPVEYQKEY